jgi:hypothetical protein
VTAAEVEALRRPFRLGVLAVAIGFVLVGGLIAAFGSGQDRPEGAAERWLTHVGDTTRKGIGEDSKKEVAKDGDPSLAAFLIGANADKDGKSTFTAIEVGQARRLDSTRVEVPVLLSYRSDAEAFQGTVTLQKQGEDWKIVGAANLDPTLRVPSEGGKAVANASLGLYAGAALIGLLVTACASALVQRAGRVVTAS